VRQAGAARNRRTQPTLVEVTGPARGQKVRPLDYLSWEERHAAALLEKGGFRADYVRTGGYWGDPPDAYRYQTWLYDNRLESAC
jgi:hypothetical protein